MRKLLSVLALSALASCNTVPKKEEPKCDKVYLLSVNGIPFICDSVLATDNFYMKGEKCFTPDGLYSPEIFTTPQVIGVCK